MEEHIRKAIQVLRANGKTRVQIGEILRTAGIKTPAPNEAPYINKILADLSNEGEILDLSTTNKGWGYSEDHTGYPSYSVGAFVRIL